MLSHPLTWSSLTFLSPASGTWTKSKLTSSLPNTCPSTRRRKLRRTSPVSVRSTAPSARNGSSQRAVSSLTRRGSLISGGERASYRFQPSYACFSFSLLPCLFDFGVIITLYHYYTQCTNLLAPTARRLVKRVKQLREEPYTQKEAEAAVGLGTDNKGPDQTSQSGVADVDMS